MKIIYIVTESDYNPLLYNISTFVTDNSGYKKQNYILGTLLKNNIT